jgi:hypothetical protein
MPVTLRDLTRTLGTRQPEHARPPKRARRVPPAVLAGGVTFAIVAGVLLIRNAFLFTTPLYEDEDMAANSILIEQARRFTLLVGNYSRERFSHPGPAFLYVESWGESLFWAALRVVPTAWNGQLIAVYALNALFAALVVAVGYGWTRSVRGAAGVLAVTVGFGALHPAMFSMDWMPYQYVPAYFAFLVAIASVAAGRTSDSWIAALTGWSLIHGHACFLMFVPALTLAAVLARRWSARRSGRRWSGPRLPRSRPRWQAWLPVGVISAVFALPMGAELALHWPGNFGKYFTYGASGRAGGHGAAQVAGYVLWFWWPHQAAWAAPVLGFGLAGLLTWRLPAGPVRRFCASLLVFDALSTAVFIGYAATGIDHLSPVGYYIGYFYWSAPAITVLVIVLALLDAAPAARRVAARRVAATRCAVTAAAVTAAVAACAAFALAPQTRTSTSQVDPATVSDPDTDPALPAAVARLAALADGRPIVLSLAHYAWPDMTGLLVQAERTGVTACVANSYWEFMVTSEFICTPGQLANGVRFDLFVPGEVPRGMPVVLRLRRAIVTGTPSGT